jgi:hypothetical protein
MGYHQNNFAHFCDFMRRNETTNDTKLKKYIISF